MIPRLPSPLRLIRLPLVRLQPIALPAVTTLLDGSDRARVADFTGRASGSERGRVLEAAPKNPRVLI